jgi:hypothetical protein
VQVDGSEAEQEPQRLLGATVRAMHTRPTLARKMVSDTVSGSTLLANSDLAGQEELVNFSPLPLSLDDLSKLWSIFFQTTYSLSIAYQATVVLIDAEELPRTPRPVKDKTVRVVPFDHPNIEEAVNVNGDPDPVLYGDVLVLRGRQLSGGGNVGLRVGDRPDLLTPDTAADTEVRVTLVSPPAPRAPLRAGVWLIQLVRQLNWGTDALPDLRNAFESNGVPVMIRPLLQKTAAGDWATLGNPSVDANGVSTQGLAITVSPPIQDGQRVFVLLNEDGPNHGSFTVPVPAAQLGATIQVTLSGVPPATYWLRVRVDRADSLLDLDPSSPNYGPRITIT